MKKHKIKNIRVLRKHWRKNGSIYCLLIAICGIWNIKIFGVATLLMLTVPCGIKSINTDKRIWYLRQLSFLINGLVILLLS